MQASPELVRAALRARNARRQLAREDVNTFAEMVIKDEEKGTYIKQSKLHETWNRLAEQNNRCLIWSAVEHGKALALDTCIPTPSGFKPMGELRVGDQVFGRDGKAYSVTKVTPVQHNRQVYRVTFDDGAELLADAAHLWVATDVLGKQRREEVVTTRTMLARGVQDKRGASRFKVPLAAPAEYPHAELPVHPYVLGVWLGDGNSNEATLTFARADRDIYELCCDLEGATGTLKAQGPNVLVGNLGGVRKGTPRAKSLTSRLRALGLLGNKHIPAPYLRASVPQRFELLKGLLDTDGSISGRNPRVEFSNMNALLATQVLELVRSLGFKASMITTPAKLNGRVVGDVYRVCFTATVPVFRLQRKLERQRLGAKPHARASGRFIRSIVEIPSVPVRCISVASPDSTYQAGRDYVVTHNTWSMSIVRTLWELGRNPNLRFCIISNTGGQAAKIAKPLLQYIEQSDELHEVFPNLVPSPDERDPWHAGSMTVKRDWFAKDPSVQVTGMHGNILGARIDRLIIDDVLDYENTRTQHARDDAFAWLQSTFAGRMTADAKILVVGTAFHPDDVLHRYAKLPGYVARKFPVYNEQGQFAWPERWNAERITQRRKDLHLSPVEFERQMLCRAREDSTSRFQRAWIDEALRKGVGRPLTYALRAVPSGCAVYSGVDLAVQRKENNDRTCIFTIMVYPNGDREVLSIESGKWSAPEIISRVAATHTRLRSVIVVENNAAQDYLVQFMRQGSAIPIVPFTTGRNKSSPEFGIESLAAEMANGKWIIPNDGNNLYHPEVSEWIKELLFYNPAGHTGDRLMAAWFAKEGARMSRVVAEAGNIELHTF